MKVYDVLALFTLIIVKSKANDRPCRPLNYGYDSVACVCDIDYCDSANPRLPSKGQFLVVTSNKAGLRFASHYGFIQDNSCYTSTYNQFINKNRTVFLTLNRKNTAQTIIGFGGAITDAVGMNLNRLSPGLQDMVVNEFYGPKGLKYNMVRTTIGHSDYSDGPYYNNNKTYDINMTEWRLTYQDYNYRIPYIKKAKNSTEDQLFLIASLWTVPDWMRKFDDQGLRAEIIEDYYYSYALYIIKYLEAFAKEGLKHWGISYVNEPQTTLGLTLGANVSQMMQVWNGRQLAKFAVNYFIPMLNKDFGDVKILHFDDNRVIIRSTVMRYLREFTDLTKYIEYVALHGYLNSEINVAVIDNLHRDYPNVTIINSEFATGTDYNFNKSGNSMTRSFQTTEEIILESNTALDRRKRTKRSMSDGRVSITQHFTERTVTPGGDISMQCAATADRPPQFVWERDGVVITSNTDPRYALGQLMTSDNSVVAQLNITRVRVEDGGQYSCIAREGEFVASHENRLDVYGPPYIRALPSIKIQSGEAVNLRCPFYGYPISKIDWEHEGKTITSHPFQTRYKRYTRTHKKSRRNAPIVNLNGVLTIPEITKEQNGAVFTCVVTSPSGEMARRAFEIQVIEAPVLEDLLLGANLQEGQIVNIYCNVRSGDLPIHFEWLKDGKRIPNNLKVVERNSELFSALVIKKVSLEHCGTYTCVASNHVAKVNRSTELYIKVAPKWLEQPKNSSLLLGRRGVVSCSASGYPQPQVHWMKKDGLLGTWQPVLELAGGGILSLPNGSLVIEEVSLTDEGLYSCNVENGVGYPLSSTVWMTVNKPVHFETISHNVTTRLGHAVTFECHPLGDNPIRVTWTHDGRTIDFRNQRAKLSETKTSLGVISTVTFQYSEIGDGGVYQCRATNPFGAASFNIFHTILEPPTPPLDVRVESVKSRQASLTWRDTIRAHVQYYSLQYVLSQFAIWEQASGINVTRQDKELRQSIDLQNLRPATAYEARIASGNQVDLSPYTAPVHFTTLEEAPSAPPSNVQVEQTENPGELHVSWLPPLKDTHNGVIIGYHVKAVPQASAVSGEGDTRLIKVTHQNGKHETLLSGLLKNVRYSVSVSASTNAGSGPFSIPVYQDTKEGAPEQPPPSVECTAVSSTSLRVGWQPIVLPGQGSSLVGYNVLYSTEDGAWQNATSLHTEFYIQGLLKFTNYTVKVAGFSSFGVGPYSYPIVCATLEDVPGPPSDIKGLVTSSSSLLVSWKRPEHPNGLLIRYHVYVKPTSSTSPPASYHIEADNIPGLRTHTLEVKELSSGRQYEVWVSARNGAGEGSGTKRILNTPSNRVVAGVASLGGTISVGVGSSLLLVCQCVGSPPPRTVWYHKHNIITHHPRFTRNHDDSLLINNIDQSLSGNYNCLAKNLYGSDSVEYTVIVLPLPEAPILRATPNRNSILVEWEQPHYSVLNTNLTQKISYSLTWKEANGPWQGAWPSNKIQNLPGIQRHTLSGLKCGTKYSLRITATNKMGTSQPAYFDVSTLGGVPIPPLTNEWLWSNATHIHIQLTGWDDNGCDINSWDVDYRPLGMKHWIRAENRIALTNIDSWHLPQYHALPISTFSIADLVPATWYQVRVAASNEAGSVHTVFICATKTVDGNEISPPSELFDINMFVITCSSILLGICLMGCVYILFKRHKSGNLIEYRDSITVDNKSESGNLTTHTSHSNLANVKENVMNVQNNCNRIYSAPIPNLRNNSKHELYEISPYAQFAVGFRTFGHVENQDLPSRHARQKYDTETSFQVCSESEDSDSISKSTLKSVPRKVCRTPHHR